MDNSELKKLLIEIDDLTNELYYYNAVGGRLHIVVDDFNYDDGSLKFCKNLLTLDPPENKAELKITQSLIDRLEKLSSSQRVLHHSWWSICKDNDYSEGFLSLMKKFENVNAVHKLDIEEYNTELYEEYLYFDAQGVEIPFNKDTWALIQLI